jgi:hypothetical protein
MKQYRKIGAGELSIQVSFGASLSAQLNANSQAGEGEKKERLSVGCRARLELRIYRLSFFQLNGVFSSLPRPRLKAFLIANFGIAFALRGDLASLRVCSRIEEPC